MVTALAPVTSITASVSWQEAPREFLLHLQAARAKKTVSFYLDQLLQLFHWADREEITVERFGKRHMDRYLVYRKESGMAALTMRHDPICAKMFFKWCARRETTLLRLPAPQ